MYNLSRYCTRGRVGGGRKNDFIYKICICYSRLCSIRVVQYSNIRQYASDIFFFRFLVSSFFPADIQTKFDLCLFQTKIENNG